MNRAPAVVASVFLCASPAAASDAVECPSAKQCLAQARAALQHKRWNQAEELAAYALDWAEPRDAASTQAAYQLAAQASLGAGKPLRALAWTSAGLEYPGPWAVPGRQQRPKPSPALEQLHRKVLGVAAARNGDIEGYYIRYVGRGVWNTLVIKPAEPEGERWLLNPAETNSYRWQLDAFRPGGGVEPVRRRGPAQMSEGNEGLGVRRGEVLPIEYESALDPARKCSTRIELSAYGVEVVDPAAECPMGNPGVGVWGLYRRVERE